MIEETATPERELSRNDMLYLLNSIDFIVERKLVRFKEHVQRIGSDRRQNAAQLFRAITKPQDQIQLLVDGIRAVFSSIDATGAEFRVGLLSVEHGKFSSWFGYSPIGRVPRTTPNELNAPTSTASNALKTQSIVVIDDIQRELTKRTKNDRRYFGGQHLDEDGSQLCIPVFDPSNGQICYVLTVAGNRQKCLCSKNSELYSWILHRFVSRIQLEHCLLQLRGSVA